MKINTDDNMNLATGYRIDSIPTLILFKDGQVVERFVGFDKFRLQEAISQMAGLSGPIRLALAGPPGQTRTIRKAVSRKIFRGRMKGERRSPRPGQSVEFVPTSATTCRATTCVSLTGTPTPGWSGSSSRCSWKRKTCTSTP